MSEEKILDEEFIRHLVRRDGELTIAVLEDGKEVIFSNIAWGYDLGDRYAHVTTNISPFVEGLEMNLFYTNEVKQVLDFEQRYELFDTPDWNNGY